jgi:hypothetical protein
MSEAAPAAQSYKVLIASAAEELHEAVTALSAENYRVRQIYQEPAANSSRYVIFAETRPETRRRDEERQNGQRKSKRRYS